MGIKDEFDAMAELENDLTECNENIEHYLKIEEICPDCETPLEYKMIDLDERQVCEKCGYGYPSNAPVMTE